MSIKHYFLDGNTSEGYVTLIDDVVQSTDKIYAINGKIGINKTELFKQISQSYTEKGDAVIWLHNPSNEERLDGIIIQGKSTAYLDGSARTGLLGKYSSFIEKIIDFNDALDQEQLQVHKKNLVTLEKQYEDLHSQAYKKFVEGRNIHEKKEALYISAMDFEKANKVTAKLIENLFHNVSVDNEKPIVPRLFFGAATPKGAVNYIDNITSDCQKRLIIKGRSGSGKSTLMRKLGKYADNLGLSVQYFPCGLDPNSLDMVLIPSLGVAILDGTAPHVIDATRLGDEIVDMFELCMDQTIEAKHGSEFDELTAAYKNTMKEGTKFLEEAKQIGSLIDKYYEEAIQNKVFAQKINSVLSLVN